MHHNSNLQLLQSKWRWKEAFMPLWNDQDEKVPRLSPGCIAALDWIGWCSVLAESPLWWRREWKVQVGHFDEESESEKFKLDEGWSSPQNGNFSPLNNWVDQLAVKAQLILMDFNMMLHNLVISICLLKRGYMMGWLALWQWQPSPSAKC